MHTHRNLNSVMLVLLMAGMAICSTSCEKDNKGGGGGGSENVLLTLPATNVTNNSATLGGNILDSDFDYTEKGVCYSETSNPTTNDYTLAVFDDRITGTYTVEARDLSQKTTYFVRAYATNSTGTVYGNLISFTTLEGDEPLPITIYMPAEIVIDLNDLAAFQVQAVVISEEEDLISIAAYVQYVQDEQIKRVDLATDFEAGKVKTWEKAFTIVDFIGLVDAFENGSDFTFYVEAKTENMEAMKGAPITIISVEPPPLTPLTDAAEFTLGRPAQGGFPESAMGITWQANIDAQTAKFSTAMNALVMIDEATYNAITTQEDLIATFDSESKTSEFIAKCDASFTPLYLIVQDGATLRLVKMTALNFMAGANTAYFTERH